MTSVSVILCSYNDGDVLPAAIRSVLGQTLPAEEFELVVVDDGSDDDTRAVVGSFADEGSVTYVRNETNRGLVASANRGLRTASGQYVTRLDADDAFAPSALEVLLDTMEARDTDLVYGDRYEVDRSTGDVRYVDTNGDFDVFDLIAIGTLYRRDRALYIGGYRDLFWEEHDFYIRYLQESEHDTVHVQRPLMVYLQHGESMTADDERVREGWRELLDEWGKQTLREYGTLPSHITNHEP